MSDQPPECLEEADEQPGMIIARVLDGTAGAWEAVQKGLAEAQAQPPETVLLEDLQQDR